MEAVQTARHSQDANPPVLRLCGKIYRKLIYTIGEVSSKCYGESVK